MNKQCGTCKYWEYKGNCNQYDPDEGYCNELLLRKKQNDLCSQYQTHPMLMEEECQKK